MVKVFLVVSIRVYLMNIANVDLQKILNKLLKLNLEGIFKSSFLSQRLKSNVTRKVLFKKKFIDKRTEVSDKNVISPEINSYENININKIDKICENKFKQFDNPYICENDEFILNPFKIQMISNSLHKQLFPNCQRLEIDTINDKLTQECIKELKRHNLWTSSPSLLSPVSFNLPSLLGNSIAEHFKIIGEKQVIQYHKLLQNLASLNLPLKPSLWIFQEGWTRYLNNGMNQQVTHPDDDILVFDVEVLISRNLSPILAVAASSNYWYSWCCNDLVNNKIPWKKSLYLDDFIPLEYNVSSNENNFYNKNVERIAIGHNVSFDRARIKEQYLLQDSKLKFLDTMSLHIAISGLTTYQRSLLQSLKNNYKKETKELKHAKTKIRGPYSSSWVDIASTNSLEDILKLYYPKKKLNKSLRDVFLYGTLNDVREDIQKLFTYCAEDVEATHMIFKKLWPQFNERFPHPVTLAGMLEMGLSYLPINQNWNQYINFSEEIFKDLEAEMKSSLIHLANKSCNLLHEENDPWLWDLDWSVKKIKLNKNLKSRMKINENFDKHLKEVHNDNFEKFFYLEKMFAELMNSKSELPKHFGYFSVYPAWYRKLISKEFPASGPCNISTSMLVTSKLLRLTWEGYPLHYSHEYGWGYVVPNDVSGLSENASTEYPLKEVCQLLKKNHSINKLYSSSSVFEKYWNELVQLNDQFEVMKCLQNINKIIMQTSSFDNKKDEAISLPYMPNCSFYKLPHKDGPGNNVGNPLSKDFLSKIENGTLNTAYDDQATTVLKINQMISYWRNNRHRIKNQLVVWLDEKETLGAILPCVITAGTLTRRAVEPTWMTASNAYKNRVGSELKAMIQSPPGYHFVGADVDSQELWIAAILGDAYCAKIHGCTPLSWMTLQGNKSLGTDMHSKTAELIGINRDEAKVLNYGRIYGAGRSFAERLLLQFNHHLSKQEASKKANSILKKTKGIQKYILNQTGMEIVNKNNLEVQHSYTRNEINSLKDLHSVHGDISENIWEGGTESAMFNMLEKIAKSESPVTPVLGCRISKALEPHYVQNNFMTSRINWVVQSSAVDYLHLLLVAMRYLCDYYLIKIKFCISIHDEVRYLVKSEDRYRAALALQVANIWVRSMFSFQLGMMDLPERVAFFELVDLDTVLRKDVNLDCSTPSNPHGLSKGYNIHSGESLTIHDILAKTGGSLLPH